MKVRLDFNLINTEPHNYKVLVPSTAALFKMALDINDSNENLIEIDLDFDRNYIEPLNNPAALRAGINGDSWVVQGFHYQLRKVFYDNLKKSLRGKTVVINPSTNDEINKYMIENAKNYFGVTIEPKQEKVGSSQKAVIFGDSTSAVEKSKNQSIESTTTKVKLTFMKRYEPEDIEQYVIDFASGISASMDILKSNNDFIEIELVESEFIPEYLKEAEKIKFSPYDYDQKNLYQYLKLKNALKNKKVVVTSKSLLLIDYMNEYGNEYLDITPEVVLTGQQPEYMEHDFVEEEITFETAKVDDSSNLSKQAPKTSIYAQGLFNRNQGEVKKDAGSSNVLQFK